MKTYELTDEEFSLIKRLRQEKHTDYEELKSKINEFIDKLDELEDLATEIYTEYTTNNKAREVIVQNCNLDDVILLYKLGGDR